jgi:hypothetical protein
MTRDETLQSRGVRDKERQKYSRQEEGELRLKTEGCEEPEKNCRSSLLEELQGAAKDLTDPSSSCNTCHCRAGSPSTQDLQESCNTGRRCLLCLLLSTALHTVARSQGLQYLPSTSPLVAKA